MISIITPTYNRAKLLNTAYESLLSQESKNFEWIIVDDGSTDNTRSIIDKFKKDKKISITYIKKSNGGKHTALNEGIKLAKGKFIMILDSDDYLTKPAIALVENKWKKYESNKNIACISFLKMFPNNKVIGKRYKEAEVISNNIDFRYNKNILGDMCEVFRTSILKKYPFPTFKNEIFLSEAIVWNRIAINYDTVYINTPIYVADYYSDGLSKNFFKLIYKNPLGAAANSNQFLIRKFKLRIRIKNAVLYNCYSLLGKINNPIHKSNDKILTTIFFPAGYLLYILFIIKNKKR